jgi:hypothetical protein
MGLSDLSGCNTPLLLRELLTSFLVRCLRKPLSSPALPRPGLPQVDYRSSPPPHDPGPDLRRDPGRPLSHDQVPICVISSGQRRHLSHFLHCAQAKRARTAPSFLHQIRRGAHRWKGNTNSNAMQHCKCCTVHERVRSMHFCAISVCMSSTWSRPGRDLIATWNDDHRHICPGSRCFGDIVLCNDLSRAIATVHDQPETLHNPLVNQCHFRYRMCTAIPTI